MRVAIHSTNGMYNEFYNAMNFQSCMHGSYIYTLKNAIKHGQFTGSYIYIYKGSDWGIYITTSMVVIYTPVVGIHIVIPQ